MSGRGVGLDPMPVAAARELAATATGRVVGAGGVLRVAGTATARPAAMRNAPSGAPRADVVSLARFSGRCSRARCTVPTVPALQRRPRAGRLAVWPPRTRRGTARGPALEGSERCPHSRPRGRPARGTPGLRAPGGSTYVVDGARPCGSRGPNGRHLRAIVVQVGRVDAGRIPAIGQLDDVVARRCDVPVTTGRVGAQTLTVIVASHGHAGWVASYPSATRWTRRSTSCTRSSTIVSIGDAAAHQAPHVRRGRPGRTRRRRGASGPRRSASRSAIGQW